MASKIDHKEMQKRLKEDEVAVMLGELTAKSRSIYHEYGNIILMIIGVIIVGYIAYYLWQQKSQADYVTVQEQFAVANTLMQQENYEAAAQQFDVLLNDFPDSNVSSVAYLLRADNLYKNGEYEQALSNYQSALTKLKGADAVLAQVGMIQSYRSLHQPEQALAVVQEALQSAKSDELINQLRFLEGACLEDSGQEDQALKVYKSIDSESSWFSQARVRIDWLEAEAVQPVN